MANQVSDEFKKAIKDFLDEEAAFNDEFREFYNNPSKNLDKCCDYIISEVKNSGRAGFADKEIFGMAVHYYEESDEALGEIKPANCKVVVNHSIDLTESEKAEARRAAMAKVQREEEEKIKARRKPKSSVSPEIEELTLF